MGGCGPVPGEKADVRGDEPGLIYSIFDLAAQDDERGMESWRTPD